MIDDDDAAAIGRRLLAMHKSLADSLEWIEDIAVHANAAGKPGLAFASWMLKDALAAWRTAMTDYVRDALAERGDL